MGRKDDSDSADEPLNQDGIALSQRDRAHLGWQ
jgi:hypothetical protein